MKRFIDPVPQYLLFNGDLASAGKLYFYENGSTTTKKDTYADDAGTVKNQNPVILSGEGRVPPIFGEGLYTLVFKDQNDIQQWVRNAYEFTSQEGQYSAWSPANSYDKEDIVRDGGAYWIADKNNSGVKPEFESNTWSPITFIEIYNPSKNGGYSINDVVSKDGRLYRSSTDSNTTTPPGANWENLTFNNAVAGDFSVEGNLTADSVTSEGASQVGTGGTRTNFNALGQISKNGGTYRDIPQRRSQRITLGGSFTGAAVVERIGNIVTFTSVGVVGHPPASDPASSSGAIPSDYRCGSEQSGGITCVVYVDQTKIIRANINNSGLFSVSYRDYSGNPQSLTNTVVPVSFSYTITSETA